MSRPTLFQALQLGIAAGGLFIAWRGYQAARNWYPKDSQGKPVAPVAAGVVAVGDLVGLPHTDAAKCKAAIAAGHLGDAAAYCPAASFIGGALPATWHAVGNLFGGGSSSQAGA